jgi:hypothetical protein
MGKTPKGLSCSDLGLSCDSMLAKADASPGPILAKTGIPLPGPKTILVSEPLLSLWGRGQSAFSSSQAFFSSTLRPLPCCPASSFRRNTRQPGPRPSRRGNMYFATVACETFSPSLRSSPWIRGAPQRELDRLICPIKLTNAPLSGGRPGLRLPWPFRQHFQMPSRRQRNTVAGLAATRDFGQRSQTAENRIHKHRSAPLNCGRRCDRRMTINWCESARCSNTRSRRDRSADTMVARTWLSGEIIVGQESVAELVRTQQISCGWNFW